MKRNLLKRIGAVALAVAVSLTMGTAAFAADMETDGTIESDANSVTLKKAIKITNYSGYAYEPTITYTYTLSDGTASGKVTDKDGNTANFKAGLTSYLASGSAAAQTAAFSSATAATSGSNAEKDLTWTFDPSSFPSAGVYRFVVAETATSVSPASIGIERASNYDTSKFLDVYVKNGTDGLEIYGYALVNDEASAVTKDSAKSQGWNSADSDTNHNDLDVYNTYNITITKNITGAGADMTAKYPFEVAITGNISAANVAVDGTGDNLGLSDGTATGTLGNGKTLIIKGLPTTAKFDVSETNPTTDKYEATATVANITGATAVTKAALAGGAELAVVTGGDIAKASDAVTIDVTNDLGSISPTNVVMRFAPYLFILGAAIVLLVMMRRRKTHDAE